MMLTARALPCPVALTHRCAVLRRFASGWLQAVQPHPHSAGGSNRMRKRERMRASASANGYQRT